MSAGGYVALFTVRLVPEHVPTGKTTHYRGEGVLPPPYSLEIAQYSGDSGFYLGYLDENGDEMTDTYHTDIASAMAQAEWEFGVKDTDWEKVS